MRGVRLLAIDGGHIGQLKSRFCAPHFGPLARVAMLVCECQQVPAGAVFMRFRRKHCEKFPTHGRRRRDVLRPHLAGVKDCLRHWPGGLSILRPGSQ